ncbi:low temperature requirement protein A [Rhizomonospora bruguierae]|uniref:low temperature requirement protein A n=1 Tax=Rhizomonospora bruguierae TaxID=1581705 RepID=UPI001BCC0B03|nr:low temperature requirement protein A [Micromonospora sp. NBRC 107566]
MAAPSAKRVTWAELFFDLVFVFAATQVSGLVRLHRGWTGVGIAVLVLTPMYWGWIGTSVYANRRDIEHARDRLGLLGLGLAVLAMALAVPGASTNRGVEFAAAYLALAILLWLLSFPEWRGARLNPYLISAAVTGPLLLTGALFTDGVRLGLWSLAAAVELSGLRLLRRQLARVRFDTAHLSERYGLLVLIALGESLVEVGSTAVRQPLSNGRFFAVVAAYALFAGFWWAYFVFAMRGLDRAFATTGRAQTDIIRPALSYAHLPFVCGIIGAAVGAIDAIAAPHRPIDRYSGTLLAGGASLYFATFAYARWQVYRTVSMRRLATAAACAALIPFAGRMPAMFFLAALAVIVAAVNAVEEVQAHRHGLEYLWRSRRPREP